MSSSPSTSATAEAPPRAAAGRRLILRVILAGLLGCLGVFGLDALLFRTKMYPQLIEPNSSTGLFELTMRRERKAQKRYGDNLIATLGDSRLGYSPKIADELTPQTGYVFRQAGLAGTDVRSWYYMLRDLDPTRRRYRALVFALNSYEDEDGWGEPADDIRVLHYAINHLRLGDAFEFARSFRSRPMQWEAFRGCLFKGLVYQEDIREFLSHPIRRIHDVRLNNEGYEGWTWNYIETPRNMVGLQIDWNKMTAVYPPGADINQITTVKAFLMYPPPPQTGHFAEYRRQWFGRIIDMYRGTGTKIVFLRLGRGPIPRPAYLIHAKSSSIRELARRPDVILVPEDAFTSLEHPEFYKDGMHLNKAGSERFSVMMAEEVSKLLGPPQPREAAR